MSARAYALVLVASGIAVFLILRQVRRRRLRAKYALLWLGVAVVLVPFAAIPGALDWVADLVGVAYPPALLLVVGLGFFAMLSLHFSYELSRLEERTRGLAEDSALLRQRIEVLEAASEQEPSA